MTLPAPEAPVAEGTRVGLPNLHILFVNIIFATIKNKTA